MRKPHSLMLVALLAAAVTVASADDLLKASQIRWDFETGDLQGWQVMPGNTLAKQPSNNDDDRWGDSFGKQGKWFVGTYEGGAADQATGELRSPRFVADAGKLSLLIGGGSHVGATYVALCRAADDKELITQTGHDTERMDRFIWDISPYTGETLYIKAVDRDTGGWGHLNFDDIHALTPQEEAAIARAKAEAKRAAEKRLVAFRKSVRGPSRRTVYRGDSLKAVAMPMGGIGAGSIALAGDGSLREWQIFNNVDKRALVPDSFFAIRAQAAGGKPVAKLLQTAPMGKLPHVDATEFIGEYPIGMVKYLDRDLPVQASLECFSPMIPLNSRDSAIPGILFYFTVHNPGSKAVAVDLLASMQNAIGYDGHGAVDGVKLPEYGGNVNHLVHDGQLVAVDMENSRLDPAAKTYGRMTLAAIDNSGEGPRRGNGGRWTDPAEMWAAFAGKGTLASADDETPSEIGTTWNGALTVPLRLAAGETKTATFIISWYFPNKYADYDQNLAKYRLGNMYNNWYKDSLAPAKYLAQNRDRLARETRLYHDTFYASTLPYWFLDAVSSQSSIIRTQTCMWLEDGSFTAFEGCGGAEGCCPMNCTHVWNYEQSLSRLFPDLERVMRHIDLKIQETSEGLINHRTVLPLSLPRGSGDFIDGHMGTILKAYREHLMSPNHDFLDANWPEIRRAMDYAIRTWDADGDGVIDGEQPNTYDCAVYGPNTFIGSLWLGALRAAEEMARLEGEGALADSYHDRFVRGSKKMDELLWNGEYWVQKYDEAKYQHTQYGTGCLSDQLLGQWWAYMLGLGDLFPDQHIQTACQSIFRDNWLSDFTGFVQTQRTFAEGTEMGLLVCTWPHGGRPADPLYYRDEVWTGIEYSTAGLLIARGLTDQAGQIVKGARDRYNGTKRNPWNEIECGDNYARAMSSWGLLLNAEGYYYDGPQGRLRLAPNITPGNFRGFLGAAEGWGSFYQRIGQAGRRNPPDWLAEPIFSGDMYRTERARQEARDRLGWPNSPQAAFKWTNPDTPLQTDTIDIRWGSLRLRELGLRLPPGATRGHVRAMINVHGDTLSAMVRVGPGDDITVRLPAEVKIAAGEALTVQTTW